MDRTAGTRSNVLLNVRLPERYEVIRHIASGGMASVWCADDVLLDRRVAIKVLADHFAGDPPALRRFKREARTAARLSGHPNVVTIYDVGQALPFEPEAFGEGPGERAFIVMEFLPGGTIADALRVGEISVPETIRWLQDASSALDYAHGRGVVHRDISPGNFLLDQNRTLHVADFGVARLRSEDTITSAGQLFGTAAYLSPEQALGRPATEASDRYALAVVAFELLVGERPYVSTNFADQARQHLEEHPPRASRRNRTLPRAVDSVLARGMAKQPHERWSTAEEFIAAIEQALAGSGALERSAARAASVPVAEGPPRIFAQRSPARAVAVGALAAAALAAGVLTGLNQQGRTVAARATAKAPVQRTHTPAPRPVAVARPKPEAPPPPPTTNTASAQTVPASADALEAQGHQLLLGGHYGAAIPVLRQAVAAATPGTLTYGYALYDLGRSLILSGNPSAAIPILEQRLRIPDQIPVVLQTLHQARAAAHVPAPPAPRAAAVAPHGARGNGHHRGDQGGGGQQGGGQGD